MLTARLRRLLARFVTPLAQRLAGWGVTPDGVTLLGTVGCTASALVLFPRGDFFVGTLLVWAFVMLDMVDGAVARVVGSTKFGAVLDSTADRLVDAAVFAGIAWYFAFACHPAQRWLTLGCLLCLVLGTLTSYIRARAEGAGLNATVGLAERTERLIIVLVGTGLAGLGVPFIQAVAIWVLVALSAITVGQRLAAVWAQSKALSTS